MVSKKDIMAALARVTHPKAGTDVVSAGAIQNAQVNGSIATVTLLIDPAAADLMEPVRQKCEEAVLAIDGVTRARAIMTAQRAPQPAGHAAKPARTPPPTPKPMKGVNMVVAIASGKGGVGKSTTAVNLAFALQKTGLKVGLVDCDVYGPSASVLLGINAKPQFTDDDRIKPVYKDGLATISMSFLVDPDTAAIWRGPMVIGAIQQFLTGVAWDENGPLDIVIADLPPGTGDVQLTLAQTVNVDGAVIVSTPQDMALVDARKAVDMFNKTNTPVLGLVENMSYFACPKCGERTDIFGHGGAKATAREKGIPFLGEIPLHMDIRESSDLGQPIVVAKPESSFAKSYDEIAALVMKKLMKL